MFDALPMLEDTDFLQPDPPPGFQQNGPVRRRKRQMAEMVTDPLTLSCWMGPDIDEMMSSALPLQNLFGVEEADSEMSNASPQTDDLDLSSLNDNRAILVSNILGPMPKALKHSRNCGPSSTPKKKNGKSLCYSPIVVPKKMLCCPVPSCDKEFSDRSGLRKHRKAKHSFACPHSSCGNIFPTMEGMLAHMNAHSDDTAATTKFP
jgi:hypothetical protein